MVGGLAGALRDEVAALYTDPDARRAAEEALTQGAPARAVILRGLEECGAPAQN